MEELFYTYSKSGNYHKIYDMLYNSNIDPTLQRNRALILAVNNDHYDIVQLFLTDSRVLNKLNSDQIKYLNEKIDNPLIKYLKNNRIIFRDLKIYIENALREDNDKEILTVIKYLLDNNIPLTNE